jgi:UDP-N-acetyl-2-amino-2-deoxyglucuronate dehydrogenase
LNRINTALIGCGKVGDTHAQALSTLEESRLVAVCDADINRARAFAARYSTHQNVQAYCDVEAMLGTGTVQMVSICTPHPTHAGLTLACAQARVHALVEKPLAVDLRGCDAMIAAAAGAGIQLGAISQRRLYEPVQRVRYAIQDGKIGRPILGTLTVMGWRDEAYYQSDAWRGKWSTEGGGVMLNQTTHHLDLFQWLMGPIEELYGYWGNLNHPYIEVEDTAVAVLRFRSGALGTILLSNSQKPGFYARIHIHGQNGASVGVQTDGGSPFISGVTTTVEPPFNDIWTVPGEEHLLAGWQAEDQARGAEINLMTHYHKLQIQDFLHAILDNRPPMVGGAEGRKLVEIFSAVYRSQRDHQPIQFPLDAERGSEQFDGRLSKS